MLALIIAVLDDVYSVIAIWLNDRGMFLNKTFTLKLVFLVAYILHCYVFLITNYITLFVRQNHREL